MQCIINQNDWMGIMTMTDYTVTITFDHSDLVKIRSTINALLKKAARNKKRFNLDAINWGDLGCTDVAYCFWLNGQTGYIVTIEKLSPSASKLKMYLYDQLKKIGYENIEINFEW